MAANLIDVTKRHLELFTKGDWTAYRETLTDNAVFEEEPTRRRVEGPDAFLQLVKGWKSAFPDISVTVREAFSTGDAVIAELDWHGTQTGPLSGPFGSLPPTGKHGHLPAVLVHRFDGDRIRESRHYFDLMTLLAQLGALPQQPAAPSPR